MKNKIFLLIISLFLLASNVSAHFQMTIPSKDIVSVNDNKKISLDIRFSHPMEGHMMNMEKPENFFVKIGNRKISLLDKIEPIKIKGFNAYKAEIELKRPGDYVFVIEPKPYWEAEEDCYIIHYTKAYVNAFGLEDSWDKPVGLKTEIVPLVRPYGLWTGNIFRGIVLLDKKVVPYAEIEVEYYNEKQDVKIPSSPFITQVIKADKNGVFSYAMPKAGWWGFAALNTDDKKMKSPDGRDVDVELGALIWIKTVDMK